MGGLRWRRTCHDFRQSRRPDSEFRFAVSGPVSRPPCPRGLPGRFCGPTGTDPAFFTEPGGSSGSSCSVFSGFSPPFSSRPCCPVRPVRGGFRGDSGARPAPIPRFSPSPWTDPAHPGRFFPPAPPFQLSAVERAYSSRGQQSILQSLPSRWPVVPAEQPTPLREPERPPSPIGCLPAPHFPGRPPVEVLVGAQVVVPGADEAEIVV